ncbi:MAG: hypothetical protein II681_00060 [Bacteroidaceae bacterium]|nr:hypothetical protein [Bacteroidaceae bacterium]
MKNLQSTKRFGRKGARKNKNLCKKVFQQVGNNERAASHKDDVILLRLEGVVKNFNKNSPFGKGELKGDM